MPNTYTPQTWTDGVSSASAARMVVIETGVQGAWARELAYNQFTSNVAVTATTEATANTVVTASAVSFDGSTAVIIEFFSAFLHTNNAAAASADFWLYQDGSSIGQIGRVLTTAASGISMDVPILLRRRMTPASGSRTYSIRATTSSGTALVSAGAGGAGVAMPGYIRLERA